MKLPVKSIGIFVCGAVIASLPYTLSLGKTNAQGTATSSSGSSTSSSANSSGSKSAQSSSGGSQNAFAGKSAGANSSGGQNSSASQNAFGQSGGGSGSNGTAISALSNDDNFLYVASGEQVYTVRKSDHQIVFVQKFPPVQTSNRVGP